MQKVLSLLALAGATSAAYTPDALADQIHDLPGLTTPYKPNMFSGYVDVGGGKKMFYWHVESESSSQATDPVMMWTNGGPGCSGLGGFMTEMGPFRPNEDLTLSLNTDNWNKVANMIFIEQPVGVGFSQATPDTVYGDKASAEDMHTFLKGFLARFPAYQNNSLYITSESYGGHYMPNLATKIVDAGDLPNFKGVFLGNPITYMPYRNYGQYATYAGHNLLPLPLWQQYQDNNCTWADSAKCNEITSTMSKLTSNLDPYALDFPTCISPNSQANRMALMNVLAKATPNHVGDYFPGKYEPCDSNWAASYLNQQTVRDAIHAVPVSQVKWADCAAINYPFTDVNKDMRPLWTNLAKTDLKLVIYSGDDDSICATAGTQAFIWDLFDVKKDWAPWTTADGQTAGYLVKFDGLSLATVHGAGHMVPATRPEQGLALLKKFLAGDLN